VVAAAAVVGALIVVDGAVDGTPVAADVPPPPPPSTTSSSPAAEPGCSAAGTLAVSGSSLARNAVEEVVAAFGESCPELVVTYDPVGSGAGLQQFTTGATGMAVVDRPLQAAERTKANARCATREFPFLAQPVMVRYRLTGVGDLKLDAPTLAKIFSGTVTTWNDPAIVAQNPDAALSARPIVVVGRGDESSTTSAFQQYLAVAGGWTTGTGTTFTGKATQTAQGDSGLLAMVENTEGAIGYLTAAEGTRSQVLRIGDVAPDPEAVTTTVEGALPGDGSLKLDPKDVYGADPATGAYPLVIVSYAVTCDDQVAAHDLLRQALSMPDEGSYVYPSGQWADRLRQALR
jgi:phosphate transport system substrate-binding protein